MGDVLVKVEGISKKFCRTLKHTMLYGATDLAKNFMGINQGTEQLRNGEFWAVYDMHLELKKGECLGLIGPNGSGKSTLLKLLNGIFMPDKGRIHISGRLGALIEVGAGFHPMLTGRENIYVNGAILGMSKKEIDEKLEEIIDFSGIRNFVEAPVKHYSSGMYVRLGFAIAALGDPDILLVDEVLAVGDELFQRKCLSQIQALQSRGTIIVFVSHSVQAITELCSRAILLDKGKQVFDDEPGTVVSHYQQLIHTPTGKAKSLHKEGYSSSRQTIGIDSDEAVKRAEYDDNDKKSIDAGEAYYDANLMSKSAIYYKPNGAFIINPRITTLEGRIVNVLSRNTDFLYMYDIEIFRPVRSIKCGMMIKTISGIELGGILSQPLKDESDNIEQGTLIRVTFKVYCVLLPGVYFLNSGVIGIINGSEYVLHRGMDITSFRVMESPETRLVRYVDLSAKSCSLDGPTSDFISVEYFTG